MSSVHQLYRRLETIGKGAYGSVHKGVELATGNVVALKIINLEDDDVDGIQHEVALLAQLRDAPNVTRYYGSFLDGPRLWIVMELAQGGSIYQLMKASPENTLEERFVVVVVREVLVGLAYLHRSGVIHRDIKSANVLVTAQGRVMLCDFGVSALLATGASKRNTFIGTLNWMAPEVVQAVPSYNTLADIWSLGIMIYEMVKGQPPHSNVSQERIIQLIPRAKPPRLVPGEGSKDLLDFIPLCLTEKPSDRLPAEELLKTKWIKTAAKTPVTILKDLLLRYEAWSKSSSEAADLAEPLPWEQDEAAELGYTAAAPGENPWEFETVRGRSVDHHSPALLAPASASSPDLLAPDGDSAAPTVRPAQSKLPNSLRALFDDGTAEPPDPFRIPGFGARTDSPTPLPAPVPPPSVNPAPSRAPRRANTAGAALTHDDGPDLSKAAFSFPARAPTPSTARSRSRLGTASGTDDDEPPPPAPADVAAPGAGAFYRAARAARNVPDLDIPAPPPPAPASSVPDEPSINLEGAMMGTTTRRPPSAGRNRSRTYASPPVFQFPPPAPDSALSSGRTVRPDRSPIGGPVSASAAGPAPASASVGSGHAATHSLDAPASIRRAPASAAPALGAGLAPGANAPLPLSRTRSAAAGAPAASASGPASDAGGGAAGLALARKPSLNRLASVAVMETVGGRRGGRSGGSIAELGLRDVMKVPAPGSAQDLGIADLLPPSPSAFALAPAPRAVLNPSPLRDGAGTAAALGAGAGAGVMPPLPRPVDLPALAGSHAETHAELARVVDELGQWLALVDGGLGRLLESAGGGERIEEDEEEEMRRAGVAVG